VGFSFYMEKVFPFLPLGTPLNYNKLSQACGFLFICMILKKETVTHTTFLYNFIQNIIAQMNLSSKIISKYLQQFNRTKCLLK